MLRNKTKVLTVRLATYLGRPTYGSHYRYVPVATYEQYRMRTQPGRAGAAAGRGKIERERHLSLDAAGRALPIRFGW